MIISDGIAILHPYDPQAGEDSVTQERPVTVCASSGRSSAERQLDTPRALSSRWVSARVKISSSDCEETMNQLEDMGGTHEDKRHDV